jgi:mannose-6-phosphate isomerase
MMHLAKETTMSWYPLLFEPIYKDKIWGGRNIERLFGRDLPAGAHLGESWELADLNEGVSTVANGPMQGRTLTDLTRDSAAELLGAAKPWPNGRFPLLLKLLDANDRLSLQVHPDEQAVQEIPGSALKTECWYIVESRDGHIFKGVTPKTSPEEFRGAIEDDTVEKLVRDIPCQTGDFHYLPAGTVHALGAGLVVAEVQTPSDTTYRVTDWGRGREIHVDESMQCIRFDRTGDNPPGAGGEKLLATDYFDVYLRSAEPGQVKLPGGQCIAWMMLSGGGQFTGEGFEPVNVAVGRTVLLPAALGKAVFHAPDPARWLEVTLPEG